MKRKVLTIKVDTTNLTIEEYDLLRLSMEVQAEDLDATILESKEVEEDV